MTFRGRVSPERIMINAATHSKAILTIWPYVNDLHFALHEAGARGAGSIDSREQNACREALTGGKRLCRNTEEPSAANILNPGGYRRHHRFAIQQHMPAQVQASVRTSV